MKKHILFSQHDYFEHDCGIDNNFIHVHENWLLIDYNTGESEGHSSYETINLITGQKELQKGSTKPNHYKMKPLITSLLLMLL